MKPYDQDWDFTFFFEFDDFQVDDEIMALLTGDDIDAESLKIFEFGSERPAVHEFAVEAGVWSIRRSDGRWRAELTRAEG